MEKRNDTRVLTLKTGKILSEHMPAPVTCAILNISASGALILTEEGSCVPTEFDIIEDRDGVIRSCELRWKVGNKVGVSFK